MLDEYLLGIASADITPEFGGPLAGFGSRGIHSSIGVYHPLRAVAVAIDDGRHPMLLVSMEWIGLYDLAPRLRGRVSEITGVPEAQIVLTCTHTHCGPAIRLIDREDYGWIDDDYVHDAVEKIARAAGSAWRHRYPGTLSYGVGTCDFAVNRRAPDPDRPGRVLSGLAPNPAGPDDHDVGVLVMRSSPDRAIRGLVFSYACHPTSRDGLLIGGDYVGYAYDHLADACPTAQPAFFQGCAGDQKPGPVDPGAATFETRTLDEVRVLGQQLGRAVEAVVGRADLTPITGPLRLRQAVITLQTEPVDVGALRAQAADESPYLRRWARRHLDRIAVGLSPETGVPFEIQTVEFGESLLVVSLAGEMTVEHGLRLKRDFAGLFAHVLPLAYANEMVGYVPVRCQFSELGYEVLDANLMQGRTGRFVDETEEQIHRQIHRALEVSE